MSDQRLRELERKWRETGSVEDEAAYLRERVRVGDLTQERLELAAYCGHEGARQVLGRACIPPPSFRGLLGVLARLAPNQVFACSVGLARLAADHSTSEPMPPDFRSALRILVNPEPPASSKELSDRLWKLRTTEHPDSSALCAAAAILLDAQTDPTRSQALCVDAMDYLEGFRSEAAFDRAGMELLAIHALG